MQFSTCEISFYEISNRWFCPDYYLLPTNCKLRISLDLAVFIIPNSINPDENVLWQKSLFANT